MPIFEYVCKACDHQFEALVYGKEKAECPKCHGSNLATAAFSVCGQHKGQFGRSFRWWRLRLMR